MLNTTIIRVSISLYKDPLIWYTAWASCSHRLTFRSFLKSNANTRSVWAAFLPVGELCLVWRIRNLIRFWFFKLLVGVNSPFYVKDMDVVYELISQIIFLGWGRQNLVKHRNIVKTLFISVFTQTARIVKWTPILDPFEA